MGATTCFYSNVPLRDVYRHHGALQRRAFNVELGFVQVRNQFGGAQAQAESGVLAGAVRTIEALKDVLLHFMRHALSLITDADAHATGVVYIFIQRAHIDRDRSARRLKA